MSEVRTAKVSPPGDGTAPTARRHEKTGWNCRDSMRVPGENSIQNCTSPDALPFFTYSRSPLRCGHLRRSCGRPTTCVTRRFGGEVRIRTTFVNSCGLAQQPQLIWNVKRMVPADQ